MPTATQDLAAELQLMILSYLPATAIQKLRRLSRHFRDLIDENGHECAKLSIALSIDRLQSFKNRYIEYPLHELDERGTPISFFNAFVDFISLYGVQATPGDIHYERRRRGFIAQWVWRQVALQLQPPSVVSFDLSHSLADYVVMLATSWMLALCVYYHRPDLVTSEMWPLEAIEGKILHMSKEHLAFVGLSTPEQMQRLVHRMRESSRMFDQADFHEPISVPVEGREVEGVALAERFSDQGNSDNRNGMVSFPSQKFRVPQLPLSTAYTYCVRSEWAKQQVMAISDGKEVNAVVKAAILEEMYLDV